VVQVAEIRKFERVIGDPDAAFITDGDGFDVAILKRVAGSTADGFKPLNAAEWQYVVSVLYAGLRHPEVIEQARREVANYVTGEVDKSSSASRQHFIDTGLYLLPGEAIEA
jgi:hypothetical protein